MMNMTIPNLFSWIFSSEAEAKFLRTHFFSNIHVSKIFKLIFMLKKFLRGIFFVQKDP